MDCRVNLQTKFQTDGYKSKKPPKQVIAIANNYSTIKRTSHVTHWTACIIAWRICTVYQPLHVWCDKATTVEDGECMISAFHFRHRRCMVGSGNWWRKYQNSLWHIGDGICDMRSERWKQPWQQSPLAVLNRCSSRLAELDLKFVLTWSEICSTMLRRELCEQLS
jgi:hypothetical protein